MDAHDLLCVDVLARLHKQAPALLHALNCICSHLPNAGYKTESVTPVVYIRQHNLCVYHKHWPKCSCLMVPEVTCNFQQRLATHLASKQADKHSILVLPCKERQQRTHPQATSNPGRAWPVSWPTRLPFSRVRMSPHQGAYSLKIVLSTAVPLVAVNIALRRPAPHRRFLSKKPRAQHKYRKFVLPSGSTTHSQPLPPHVCSNVCTQQASCSYTAPSLVSLHQYASTKPVCRLCLSFWSTPRPCILPDPMTAAPSRPRVGMV